jgi:hypothetical protein
VSKAAGLGYKLCMARLIHIQIDFQAQDSHVTLEGCTLPIFLSLYYLFFDFEKNTANLKFSKTILRPPYPVAEPLWATAVGNALWW